jgi:CheY-like chemotaxis protein/HPt (histidine-containing phosphotransfer) domain-containing protein
LGLAIAAQFVDLMHGRIWVESEPGQGSTFHFTVQIQPVPEREDLSEEGERLRNQTALVVDDNETTRRILQEQLRSWGLQADAAESFEMAARRAEEAARSGRPYRVVLVDREIADFDATAFLGMLRRIPGMAAAVLLLLPSLAGIPEAARARRLGIMGFLAKPVKPSELRASITRALLGVPREERVVRGRRSAKRRPRHRILVVEDNAVNQRLVRRILERLGHAMTLATTGREALSRVETDEFDVILMDVRMPEMDGIEATRAIRRLESERGDTEAHHVPILALTAYAQEEELDRCLAAGMDGYLIKPIRTRTLSQAIEAAVASRSVRLQVSEPRPQAQGILDEKDLLERVGGDWRLLLEIVQLFQADSPKRMQEIQRALEERDAKALAALAHTLKGSVAIFSLPEATEAAQALEDLARRGSWKRMGSALATLQAEMQRLDEALRALCAREDTGEGGGKRRSRGAGRRTQERP